MRCNSYFCDGCGFLTSIFSYSFPEPEIPQLSFLDFIHLVNRVLHNHDSAAHQDAEADEWLQ